MVSNTIKYNGVYCPFKWTLEAAPGMDMLQVFYKGEWVNVGLYS